MDHIPTLFVATKSDLDLALQVGRICSTADSKINANQRHEVQPDVYCRRLRLQVPVSVSVKTSQMADVFHVICGIAMNPYVIQRRKRPKFDNCAGRQSSMPGGGDRALSKTARVKMYVTLTAILGGCTAGLLVVYRTLVRQGGMGLWAGWLFGRR